MFFNFPPAPKLDGLTNIGVQPIFVNDRQTGQRLVFPLYHYRNDTTGHLITVAEDRYEKYHEMISQSYARKGGQA